MWQDISLGGTQDAEKDCQMRQIGNNLALREPEMRHRTIFLYRHLTAAIGD
jgi:hypothetical protein